MSLHDAAIAALQILCQQIGTRVMFEALFAFLVGPAIASLILEVTPLLLLPPARPVCLCHMAQNPTKPNGPQTDAQHRRRNTLPALLMNALLNTATRTDRPLSALAVL